MMIIRFAIALSLFLVACGEPESISGQWNLAWTSCEAFATADADMNVGSDDHFVIHFWDKTGGAWAEGDLLQTDDNHWKVSSVKSTFCNTDQSQCVEQTNAGGASVELSDDGKLHFNSQCPSVFVR